MGITAVALVAPGDIITSAQQNIVRSNFTVLDSRTGGDPGVAGSFPVSNGATSVVWTAALTAVLNALGYTPINKAGDTGIGDLTSAGTISALGLVAGANGVASAGPVNPAIYAGGSTAAGSPSVKGLIVGTDGIACAGPVTANGATIVPVPLGAIVAFATVADLTAAGASWTRHTALDGRLPVGDGTTFGQTFAAATNYGANWTPSSGLSVANVAVLADGQTVLANTGVTTAVATSTHTHPAPTLNGTSTAWLPPMRAVVWARRI